MKTSTLRRILFCGIGLSFTAFVSGADYKVGVLLKDRNNPFWRVVQRGAEDAGKAAGVEVIVKAPLTETDVGMQGKLLDVLAEKGIDALVIAPTNKDALAEKVAALAAKGVKVVVVDSPLSGNAQRVFIGTNQRAAGEAAGKLMAVLVGDKDEVAILRHIQGSGATDARESGAISVLREAHPGLTVYATIYASSEKGVEEERAALVLEKYPHVKAILASATPGTLAMLKVLQGKSVATKIKLVGFGYNLNPTVAAAIESGEMYAWMAQLPAEIGKKGVESAIALLKGEQLPATIGIDCLAITKENIKDPKVQALMIY